jgi:hypothetical protein
MAIDPVTGIDDEDPNGLARPGFAAAAPPSIGAYQPQQLPPQSAPPQLALPPPNVRMERHELTPAGRQTLGAIDANNAAQLRTAGQAGDVALERAHLDEQRQNAELAARAEYDKHRLALLDQGEKELAAARAHHQQLYDEYQKNSTVKDYWADKSTGNKIMAAIAVFLGGLGQRNGGSNGALQIINSSIDQDYARQRANIESRRQAAADAKGDIGDVQQRNSDALRALDIRQAAAIGAVKDELAKRMVALGVPQQQIETNQGIQQLEQKQLQARQAIDEKDRTTVIAGIGKRLNAGGGGGGGRGGGLSELIRMKEQGQPDSAIAARAAQLGIQAGGKQGYLQSLRDVEATQRGKRADEEATVRRANDWAKDNGVKDIAKSQRELSAVMKEIQDNPHNPLQQALAVEKAVSAARGGAASKQALGLALSHLGGSLDNAEAVIAKIKSGEIGPAQMQNFTSFIRGQLGTSQAAGKNAYDSYNDFVEAQPPADRELLLRERSRIFSGLQGFSAGKQQAGGAAAPAQKDPRIELAKEALQPNSGATVQQRAQAELILRKAGLR